MPNMPGDEAFYDHPDIQSAYFARRAIPDNPNSALENPIFLQLAGDLTHLDILDLGCGDASFGREALLKGARSYTGIEISEVMVSLARQTLANTSGTIHQASIETWQAQPEQADLVTSRLALNYVEHLKPVFQEMFATLRPGGRMILTVEHPVITSHFVSLETGRRTTWLVDNYFKPGPRVHTWLGREITKYHHTLEDYFELVKHAGFDLECIRESRPNKGNFLSQDEYERRLRIPLFLFIAARKPRDNSYAYDS